MERERTQVFDLFWWKIYLFHGGDIIWAPVFFQDDWSWVGPPPPHNPWAEYALAEWMWASPHSTWTGRPRSVFQAGQSTWEIPSVLRPKQWALGGQCRDGRGVSGPSKEHSSNGCAQRARPPDQSLSLQGEGWGLGFLLSKRNHIWETFSRVGLSLER